MIYVFLADGFEEVEALTPVDVLRRFGLEVKTVSITDEKTVRGTHNIIVEADEILKNVIDTDFDMLICPGGLPGADNLENCDGVVSMLKCGVKENKFLGAICAAPKIFGRYGIVNGKKATCFPGFEDKLKGAEVKTDCVVRDGNIITSRGIGTAMEFALCLGEALCGKEKAEEIRRKMLVL